MIDALIFDSDGVIIDTETPEYCANPITLTGLALMALREGK